MKKRYFILFLLIIIVLMPRVSADYNGNSGGVSSPDYGGSCEPSNTRFTGQNYICSWNLKHTKGLQITLYYFNEDGSRQQIGKQIHVINNKDNYFENYLKKIYNEKAVDKWLEGVIIDDNIPIAQNTYSFSASDLESYLMETDGVFEKYLSEYIGVEKSDLTKESEPASKTTPAKKGYRLVIEPMYSYIGLNSGKHELYLKTVKELAAPKIRISSPNKEERQKRYNNFSKALYLEYEDVGISPGNAKGVKITDTTEMKKKIANINNGWGYNIIDITSKLPPPPPPPPPEEPEPTTPTTCDFNLNISVANDCTGSPYGGYIKDIKDWECIYKSSSANNENIQGYFLKYGSATSSCAVYCRDELTYTYPKSGMVALAGSYFTLANSSKRYEYELVGSEYKVTAAKLGPVKVSVTRECSITGTPDATCNNKLQEQLDNLSSSSPKIKFTYNPEYYDKITETLEPVKTTQKDKTTPAKRKINEIKSRTVTYEYKLPDSTYKYVSKGIGVSYKNVSEAGVYPTIYIGPHLPIHFSQDVGEMPFELNIEKFNITNFDALVIDGKKMPKQYDNSIESYIKTLIDLDGAAPKEIGSIYYLDTNFVNLLSKEGYSVENFLAMDCANTSKYDCHSDTNGIFCLDKGKQTNSPSTTYASFNACINDEPSARNTERYKKELKYICSFDVEKLSPPPPEGLDVIFRTISLNNPFPNIDGEGRITGTNWCYGDNCSNDNVVVERVILNNRDVTTEEIYKELDPLYKIVLTPSLIKEIRKYNNTTSYDDFNLICENDSDGKPTGEKCKSNFIRKRLSSSYNFSGYFNGCGISGKSRGLSCVDNDAW